MPSSDRPELKTGTRLTCLRSLLVGYNKSRTLMGSLRLRLGGDMKGDSNLVFSMNGFEICP
jgi:hypothetical protein